MSRLAQVAIQPCGWLLRGLGQSSLGAWDGVSYTAGVIVACLALSVRPSSWPRTARNVFARQMLFTAVDGASISVRLAAAVGIMLVVQTQLWLDKIGEGYSLATPVLTTLAVRELAPLLANLVVLGRSGTAIVTELANMRLRGEVDVLDNQGIDPMVYLVMPRLLAMACSILMLAFIIAIVMFASGYVVGLVTGAIYGEPWAFFGDILAEIGFIDLCFFVPKTVFTGLFVGAILCIDGLHVKDAATEISRVVSRSAVHSLTAIFFVSAILSLLISGRLLLFKVF